MFTSTTTEISNFLIKLEISVVVEVLKIKVW